ncbi:MAG: universal stress protein [Desulfomonilaceae bacterium]|nr:universal stress protein [Desulfomonilaceae bacterium]
MKEPKKKVIDFLDYRRRKSGRIADGVGLCAIFSRQGDWAFDYALALARHHQTRLNIFHFLESPYSFRRDVVFSDPQRRRTERVTSDLIAAKDEELRHAFDDRLGDYVDVGFRLCEGNSEWELKKCFRKGQYEVLVIGYNEPGADFGGTTTIERFAQEFKGPVVLVGPTAGDSFHINRHAEKRLEVLLIPDGKWYRIES